MPSFDTDDRNVVSGPNGQLAHRSAVEHLGRLQLDFFEVPVGSGAHAWCFVGNGLSNQTFIEGPGGLIAIDTGESNEEMTAALAQVRNHTDAPITDVIYTHFHYANGTGAVFQEAEGAGADLPTVWGHEGIAGNLARSANEVGPVASRGLIHQFGMRLPTDGPDGLLSAGIGLFYRNPEHGRGTDGHVPVANAITGPLETEIAGLRVRFTPTPSDADDNINIFFPDLSLCVNNILWPALFNVFPIRGEEYRDPRILLAGIDEIAEFDPEHLIGAHGPPISGHDAIRPGIRDARDAIQFLWDQTVRGINRGLTLGELIAEVRLPKRFERSYLTQQHYGLVEHHVRQIHAGLRGWFDGYEAELFPLPALERTARLIDGFGGRAAVLGKARQAMSDNDLRWALELATWLVRSETGPDGRADGGTSEERGALAEVLRRIAQRTTAANIRNWALTRALELEGAASLERMRGFRLRKHQILAQPLATTVHGLRVGIDPEAAASLDHHVRFTVDGSGESTGLWVRGGVAVPTDGEGATISASGSLEAIANLLTGEIDATSDTLQVSSPELLTSILGCFDRT